MENNNINLYQGVIMKEMTLDKMEVIEGGSLKSMCFWMPFKIVLNDLGNPMFNQANYAIAALCEAS